MAAGWRRRAIRAEATERFPPGRNGRYRSLEQLIGIDVDGDGDVVGEGELVQGLADEPA